MDKHDKLHSALLRVYGKCEANGLLEKRIPRYTRSLSLPYDIEISIYLEIMDAIIVVCAKDGRDNKNIAAMMHHFNYHVKNLTNATK